MFTRKPFYTNPRYRLMSNQQERKEDYMENNFVLHKAGTRGHADHGWLNTYHTFSFADYYESQRVQFGALRVLNDDTVAPGMGFGTHPHANMEIISIPTSGDLEHKDSMGNVQVIKQGDIQVMSAGSGITHSEYNRNRDKPVKFFQIWVFPDRKNVEPRYGQITLNAADRKNKLQQIISPSPEDEGLWIHQQTWFHLATLDAGKEINYSLKKNDNGIYVFVIEGKVSVESQLLERRDGMGIIDKSEIKINSIENSEILLMELPMHTRY